MRDDAMRSWIRRVLGGIGAGVGASGASGGEERRRVDAEVAEELAFHVEEATREEIARGASEGEARRRALERFGDVETTRRRCTWQRHALPAAMRRATHVALATLVLAVAVQATLLAAASSSEAELDALRTHASHLEQALAEERERQDPAEIARRMGSAPTWRGALAVANGVAALPADEGLALVRETYPLVEDPERRKQFLKAFAFTWKPNVPAVLALGAADEAPEPRAWALSYGSRWALRDFDGRADDYLEWWAAAREKPLALAVEDAFRTWLDTARDLEGERLSEHLARADELLDHRLAKGSGADLEAVLMEADGGALVERWIDSHDPRRRVGAAALLDAVRPGEDVARRLVIPHLRHPDDAARSHLASSLGSRGNAWALDPLLDLIAREPTGGVAWSAARALARIGDERAVPELVDILIEANDDDASYAIGWYALEPLTGVHWDRSHDAAWWRAWRADRAERADRSERAAER